MLARFSLINGEVIMQIGNHIMSEYKSYTWSSDNIKLSGPDLFRLSDDGISYFGLMKNSLLISDNKQCYWSFYSDGDFMFLEGYFNYFLNNKKYTYDQL